MIERTHIQPTAIDLFCGCGGFSLGFINAGFHVVAGLDASSDALWTYYHNLCYEGTKIVGDISRDDYDKIEQTRRDWRLFDTKGYEGCPGPGHRKTTEYYNLKSFEFREMVPHEEENSTPVDVLFYKKAQDISGYEMLDVIRKETGIYEIDVIIGGPPCQSFSRMNTRKKKRDGRDFLVFEFGRLVMEINPKAFVMENVPDIERHRLPDGRNLIDVFTKMVNDKNWDTYYEVQALYIDGDMDPENECSIIPAAGMMVQETLL